MVLLVFLPFEYSLSAVNACKFTLRRQLPIRSLLKQVGELIPFISGDPSIFLRDYFPGQVTFDVVKFFEDQFFFFSRSPNANRDRMMERGHVEGPIYLILLCH
jgi:hypothetical protein